MDKKIVELLERYEFERRQGKVIDEITKERHESEFLIEFWFRYYMNPVRTRPVYISNGKAESLHNKLAIVFFVLFYRFQAAFMSFSHCLKMKFLAKEKKNCHNKIENEIFLFLVEKSS